MGEVVQLRPHRTVETAELRDPRDMHRHFECPRCGSTVFVVLTNVPVFPVRCAECYVGMSNLLVNRKGDDGPGRAA